MWRGVLFAIVAMVGSCDLQAQLPTQIDVRSLNSKVIYTYKIKESPGAFYCGAGGPHAGCTDCNKNTIRIDISLPQHEIKTILMHEIFHAAHRCAATPTATIGDNELHNAIYDHSLVVIDTLEINPKLLNYFTRRR
jgi:hypothetical protein